MARDCTADRDTCGTCAQKHRMDSCANSAQPHCVSCGITGHVSWDRSCPIFQAKCNELNDWLEENKLLYFPTGETWTQVREPPKVVYVVPPPPRVSHMHQGNEPGDRQAQSTLQWQNTGPSLRGQPPPSQQSGWHSQFNRNCTDRSQATPHHNV